MKSDGNLDKFKARLVACGFAQVHGQNYFETFAPAVSLENVQIVLAVAAHFDWDAHQVDAKTAFLNAPLDGFWSRLILLYRGWIRSRLNKEGPFEMR